MAQTQRRKTKVIRVIRRYEYLCKAFTCYLQTLPHQDKLWELEDTLSTLTEESQTESERHKKLAKKFGSHFHWSGQNQP